MQNTFLPLELLFFEDNSTIKRLIVQDFHRRVSVQCFNIVAISAQEIASIVVHPFSPTKVTNRMEESCCRAQLNHLCTLGVFQPESTGGVALVWRRKMGAKFLADGWRTAIFKFLGPKIDFLLAIFTGCIVPYGTTLKL